MLKSGEPRRNSLQFRCNRFDYLERRKTFSIFTYFYFSTIRVNCSAFFSLFISVCAGIFHNTLSHTHTQTSNEFSCPIPCVSVCLYFFFLFRFLSSGYFPFICKYIPHFHLEFELIMCCGDGIVVLFPQRSRAYYFMCVSESIRHACEFLFCVNNHKSSCLHAHLRIFFYVFSFSAVRHSHEKHIIH